MKTKSLATSCILLSVGFILHAIVPGIGTMKPDFLLAMMILAIVINPVFSMAMSIAFVASILSALTTVFPGGQILSFLDKFGSAIVIYLLFQFLKSKTYSIVLVSAVGTFISGIIFILGAMFISGMDTSLLSLIGIVVIPTTILNTILIKFVYERVLTRLKIV